MDPDESEQPKLKLKKILTPLSPHLKVQRPQSEDGLERKRPRIEIPRAVPMEIEPELPPPPPELTMTAPTGPGFDQPLTDAPAMTAPTGPGFDQPLPDPAGESIDREQAEQTAEESGNASGEAAAKATSAARPTSLRRIAILLVPVALVIAALFIVNYLFDPFGLKMEPIQPMSSPLLARGESLAEQANAHETISGIDLYVMLDDQSLDAYLKALQNQKIYASVDPGGIFIGAAFIPLGSSVNPSFGLTLNSIDKAEAVLVDEYLNEYRIPLR